MGYFTRPGTSITDFRPDDDANTMHLESSFSYSMQQILDMAKEKWGSHIQLGDIEITSEFIHTHCIGYDCYDSGDYTDYIIVTHQ